MGDKIEVMPALMDLNGNHITGIGEIEESKSLSFNYDDLDKEVVLLHKMLANTVDNENSPMPVPCEIQYTVTVPYKKHKKKRINKKWLKRYGYKMETKVTNGWDMIASTDGSITFVTHNDTKGE